MLYLYEVIMFTLFFLIYLSFLVFCWYYWKISRTYKHFPSKRLDVEFICKFFLGKIPSNVPLTCHVFQLFIKAVKTFQAEGIFVLWFIRPYVVVYGEEFMKDLVNNASLANKSWVYDLNKPFLGNGIIVSKHDVWKVQHKTLVPALNIGAVKSKTQLMNKNAALLLKELEAVANKPVEHVWDILKVCSFHIMSESIIGVYMTDKNQEISSQRTMKLVDVGTAQFIERIVSPWLYWELLLPLFDAGRKYLNTVQELSFLANSWMKELLKAAVVSGKEQQGDIGEVHKSAGRILTERYLQDPNVTQKDVTDQIVSLVVGGYHTISISMMWCLYLLGHHPKEQERVYEEVMAVANEETFTYEDTCEMKYTECVVKETLRLYTPVPIYARTASKEIQCGNYTIPKGAEVMFFPFMLHRNPYNFSEPEKFKPDRFSEGSNIRPWMHIPFADGYRDCVGKRFAMLELKILLAHVIRRFRITSLDKTDDSDLDWAMIIKPLKKPRLLFEPRFQES